MTPDALNFASDIRRLITQGDLDGALGFVRFIVEHIRHDPASVGQTLTSPVLDRLCGEIGALSLLQLRSARQLSNGGAQPADVIIIATELYAMGGHTRIIEDIVAAQPDKRHLILLTDFFTKGVSYLPSINAEFRVADSDQRIDKLVWLQQELASSPEAQVLIFNHHADAAAIAAIQPGLNRDVVFCHHADHHLCLGAHLGTHIPGTRHVDFFAHHHHRCCESGIAAEYWPLSVPDRGTRSHAANTFLQQKNLVTCTSGVWTKFNPLYPFHYWEELPGILLASGGTHIHIGDIPTELLEVMRQHLAANGIKPDRFIHIPKVSSVWETLIEKKVDLYIGSFPLGGGRALIEAMGAGMPIVTHTHPMLGANGLGPAGTWAWSTPEELRSILKGVTRENLSERSKASREHYLQFHNPQIFNACLIEGKAIPRQDLKLPATDAVTAYLLRSASREEDFDAVFEQLKQRVANNNSNKTSSNKKAPSVQTSLESGIALFHDGKLEEAYAVFSDIVDRAPNTPIALIHLGLIAISAGLADDANVFFNLAIECSPNRANAQAAIGQHCLDVNELTLAEQYLSQASKSNPRLVGAYALLTDVWQRQGRVDEALASLTSRVQQNTTVEPEILSRLVTLARKLGDEDLEYAVCVRAKQYPELHCRAISLMNRRADVSRSQLSAEARRFAATHAKTRSSALPFGSRQRLRIGFVVGRLDADEAIARLEPLLCQLDPSCFDTALFFDEIFDSASTQRALLVVDQCDAIAGLNTHAAIDLIRKQNIDVLFNVQLHDNLPTLLIFEQRAAPLQINWSAPSRTSGLANMDYILCAEKDYVAGDFTEKLLAIEAQGMIENADKAFAESFSKAILSRWQQHGGSVRASS